MHLSELLTRELDALRERCGRDELHILETGSIRNEAEQYHQNDGWSTLTFAQYVDQYGGSVVSIDLDTRAAHAVLTRHGFRDRVDLVQEHSISALGALVAASKCGVFDVILLDSDNDDNLILHEYLLASYLLAPGGVLMVDDVEPGSDLVIKGRKLLPWLSKEEVQYRLETRTGADLTTGVLVMNS